MALVVITGVGTFRNVRLEIGEIKRYDRKWCQHRTSISRFVHVLPDGKQGVVHVLPGRSFLPVRPGEIVAIVGEPVGSRVRRRSASRLNASTDITRVICREAWRLLKKMSPAMYVELEDSAWFLDSVPIHLIH